MGPATLALVSILSLQGPVAVALGAGAGRPPDTIQDGRDEDADDERQEVPSADDFRRGRAELRKKYRSEYKLKQPEDRAALASEFLTLAGAEPEPNDLSYVLLDEALTLATEAADLGLVRAASTTMGTLFKVDDLALRYEAFDRIRKKNRRTWPTVEAVSHVVRLAQDARIARRHSIAEDGLARAQAAAKVLKDDCLEPALSDLGERVSWEKMRWARVKRSGDSSARARFEFLAEHRLGSAANYLSSDNGGLLWELARLEQARPAGPEEQLELAQLWTDLARGDDWAEVLPFRRRAVTWYLRARQGLPLGLDRRAVDKVVLKYYLDHHDPFGGVPVDPWEQSLHFDDEQQALAGGLLWHGFAIYTDRRFTFSYHHLHLHNLSGEPRIEGRLRARLSLLCVDGEGTRSVLRKEHGYQVPRFGLLDARRDQELFVHWKSQQDMLANDRIEQLNGGEWVPSNAHLLVTLDGVPVFESLWKEPDSLWWLDDELVR